MFEMIQSFIMQNEWAALAAGIIAILNVFTATLPSEIKGNSNYNALMRVANWGAGNVGKNKNADES